jgi:hypothetical protein
MSEKPTDVDQPGGNAAGDDAAPPKQA